MVSAQRWRTRGPDAHAGHRVTQVTADADLRPGPRHYPRRTAGSRGGAAREPPAGGTPAGVAQHRHDSLRAPRGRGVRQGTQHRGAVRRADPARQPAVDPARSQVSDERAHPGHLQRAPTVLRRLAGRRQRSPGTRLLGRPVGSRRLPAARLAADHHPPPVAADRLPHRLLRSRGPSRTARCHQYAPQARPRRRGDGGSGHRHHGRTRRPQPRLQPAEAADPYPSGGDRLARCELSR